VFDVHKTTKTVLRPFVWDYPGESVPEGYASYLHFAPEDIATPAPHQSDFYGPDTLPDTQPAAFSCKH